MTLIENEHCSLLPEPSSALYSTLYKPGERATPFCAFDVNFTEPELSLAVTGDHVTILSLSVTYN